MRGVRSMKWTACWWRLRIGCAIPLRRSMRRCVTLKTPRWIYGTAISVPHRTRITILTIRRAGIQSNGSECAIAVELRRCMRIRVIASSAAKGLSRSSNLGSRTATGQCHPLHFATGERGRVGLQPIRQPHFSQGLHRASLGT